MLIATNGMCYLEELVQTVSDGGLHLPQGSKRKHVNLRSGIVYAIDKNHEDVKGWDAVEKGDTIVFPPAASCTPIRLKGKDLLVINAHYIAGIIAKASDKADDLSTAENSTLDIPKSTCLTNVSGENN